MSAPKTAAHSRFEEPAGSAVGADLTRLNLVRDEDGEWSLVELTTAGQGVFGVELDENGDLVILPPEMAGRRVVRRGSNPEPLTY